MIDSKYRSYLQTVFDALGKGLIKFGFTPNAITIIAFILGVLAGTALSFAKPILALMLMGASGVMDVLDGTVARITGKSTKLGAFLDLIFDRMVEAAIIIGFYFFHPEFALVYLIFFAGAMFNFTTFMLAGSLFENKGNKSMHYDVGLIERTETFMTFALMMIFPNYIMVILGIFNVLMIFTGIMRISRIIKHEK